MKEKNTHAKNAAERQVSLITDALSKAAGNNRVWAETKKESNIHVSIPRERRVQSVQCHGVGIKLRQERICRRSVHAVQRSQETRRGGDGT